jgi:alkyl hydroperoxide reductase 1
MPGLSVGEPFPEGVSFTYVAPTGELDLTACGLPIQYDASKGIFPLSPSPTPSPS